MKTTIDIPDGAFNALLKLSGAKTKREAVLAAVEEYNRRHEVESLVATFGSWRMDDNEKIEAADLAEARKRT
jgi:hypothetical protein